MALTRTALEGHDETLAWVDFRGSPPANSPSSEAAYTEAKFDMLYDYEWDDSYGSRGYMIGHVQVQVTVERANMWSIVSARSADLLQHEQGHYDVVALVARDLFNELTGWNSARPPKRFRREDDLTGAANRLSRAAKSLAAHLAGTASKDGVYDQQTKHGQNAKAQEQWNKSLAAARANGTGMRAVLKGLGVGASP